MNILSLFDGISCGQVAFERADIKVDKYYASEIDKYAIQITQKNYPDTTQLGDINYFYKWKLPQIDIIIGGSPCQDLSKANKGRRGLSGERSGLFYKYVCCILAFKPKYFLLENNDGMPKDCEEEITKILGVKPIKINSRNVIPQNRSRLYWTNIPNITEIEEKYIQLNDILDNDEFDETYDTYREFTNFYTIPRAKDGKLINGSYNRIWKTDKYCGTLNITNNIRVGYVDGQGVLKARKLNINEVEKLQTLPVDYTKIDGIKESARHKAVGNGWTVDVIAHIFKHIK